MIRVIIASLVVTGAALAAPPGHEIINSPRGDAALLALRDQARALRPLVETPAAHALLDAVAALPPAAPDTVYYRPGGGYLAEAFTEAEYASLSEDEREDLRAVPVDTERFYHTFYGTPLASIRAFDLAARHGKRGFDDARVVDFGFGSIGQLRLLAACGADVTGTEVMPLLEKIYADPGLQGPFSEGRVTMAFGRWPAEADVIERIGRGLDLFISKNTIKRGYVDPQDEVDPRMRMDLGVEPDVFLARLHDAVRPGGLVVFYNLGGRPAGPGEAYRPATDIACPWPEAVLREQGFDVLVHDGDDTAMARRFGAALGWSESMNLEEDLFARYTILRRPIR